MVDHPVKINKYTSPIENTRHEFLKENINPSSKKFNFSSFMTEKERIV
jgi:hypothetical protein